MACRETNMQVYTEHAKSFFDESDGHFWVRHVFRTDTDTRRYTDHYPVRSKEQANALVQVLQNNIGVNNGM